MPKSSIKLPRRSNNPVKVLSNMIEVFQDPKRWTRGISSCDLHGNWVVFDSKLAVRWCASGLLARLTPEKQTKTRGLIYAQLESEGRSDIISGINDGPDGYRRILALLKRTLKANTK